MASFSSTGIGCDAKVAYEFHVTREENPDKFYSQVVTDLFAILFLIFVDKQQLISCFSLSSKLVMC